MGQQYSAICGTCEARFILSDGGGFTFHLLRCDRCGAGRTISFEEIGEPHLRYLKGLDVPYSLAAAELGVIGVGIEIDAGYAAHSVEREVRHAGE